MFLMKITEETMNLLLMNNLFVLLQEKPTEAKKAKKDENGTAPDAEDAGDEEADDEEIEGEDEEYGDEGGKHKNSIECIHIRMLK